MQEATFLILTALAAGSQHGYGIITDVREISDGRVRLLAGTLYTALERLRADDLIAVAREEVVQTRLRRYYRIRPKGAEVLAAEAARLQANAAVAQSRLKQGRLKQGRREQGRLEQGRLEQGRLEQGRLERSRPKGSRPERGRPERTRPNLAKGTI